MSAQSIFSDWDSYFTALVTSLSTDTYNKTYPEYAALHDLKGLNADVNIVKSLLDNDLDPQDGLNGFIKSMILGSRYSKDFILSNQFRTIFSMFLAKGATINLYLLLDPYISDDPKHFEEEAYSSAVRAILIHVIEDHFNPHILMHLDGMIAWDSIIPVYWEEMCLKYTSELNPEFGDFNAARYKAIKYAYLSLST